MLKRAGFWPAQVLWLTRMVLPALLLTMLLGNFAWIVHQSATEDWESFLIPWNRCGVRMHFSSLQHSRRPKLIVSHDFSFFRQPPRFFGFAPPPANVYQSVATVSHVAGPHG